jgi:HEAT repeat protein
MTALPRYLVCVLVAAAALPGRAADVLDHAMLRDPELPAPTEVVVFRESHAGLWLQALDRPEADLRCQAALAIAEARRLGMQGLERAVPALVREVTRPDQHPTVRLAAAKALVALDAKDAAAGLFTAAAVDADLRELVEPALARWGHGPARDAWLERIAAPPPHRRAAVLAMHGLAATRDGRAVPRLRELVLAASTPPLIRIEAGRALGAIRPTGGEADADAVADPPPHGNLYRLAAVSLLRHHDGPAAIDRLRKFAVDGDPSVARVAVTRLLEIDAKHAAPALNTLLASPDANVRSLGVDVLFRLPSEDHIARLGVRLGDLHPDVRATARRHLRELAAKPEFTQPVLRTGTAALAGRDWRAKEQAAFLLAHLGHTPAAPRLVELLADPRPEAAVAAAWALRVLAVPETLPPVYAYVARFTAAANPERGRRIPADDLDQQLCHLVQFLGYARYAPADDHLRKLVPPGPVVLPNTRAAAVWALGRLHEGKPIPELAAAVAARLAATGPGDVEDNRVRRMCAVALGRMTAEDGVPTLRRFYAGDWSADPVSNACGWALEQTIGQKMPAPKTIERVQQGWFLRSLDD